MKIISSRVDLNHRLPRVGNFEIGYIKNAKLPANLVALFYYIVYATLLKGQYHQDQQGMESKCYMSF